MQALPQAPQFRGSLASDTQADGQRSGKPPEQPHLPPEQCSPGTVHAASQAPQLLGSVAAFTQAGGFPQVRSEPPSQVQAPATQLPAPQLMPQAPQFRGSLCRSAQERPQSAVPAGQEQRPPAQVPPEGQATPQAPQSPYAVSRSAQWWLGRTPHTVRTLPDSQRVSPGPQLAGPV